MTNNIQSNGMSGTFYGLAAALIWSAWPVVSRLGVQATLSAEDITAIRFFVAAALLLPWLILKGEWRLLFNWRGPVLMLGAGAPYVYIAVSGLSFAPAGQAGVLIPSTVMLMTTLVSVLWFREVLSSNHKVGILIILTGIVLIGGHSFSEGGDETFAGDLLFLLAGGLWSFYTLMAKRFSLNPLTATALVSVWSALCYGPYYWFSTGFQGLINAPANELILQSLFQGVLAAIIALLLYTKAVALIGAGKSALFGTLIPGLALMLAIPLLGEIPSWSEWAGVAVVSIGMIISVSKFSLKPNKSMIATP